jgi:enoyl-CoA hydratase
MALAALQMPHLLAPMQAMEDLLIDRPHPQIMRITFNRPDRLNALTYDVIYKFNATLDALVEDTETRAVIVTGAGRGFCAGQDMKAASERMQPGGSTVTSRFASQLRFGSMSQRMARIPQPVICAVNGVAAGAGMAIALGADIRIGTPDTRFLIAAVKIALSAGESSVSYWLPRWIGAARAFEIMLTGRPIEADEALQTGLMTRMVDPDKLQQAAIDQALLILENAPFAVSQTKRIMRRNLDAASLDIALDIENPTQIVANCTEDYVEAVQAFLEKRPPEFKGR